MNTSHSGPVRGTWRRLVMTGGIIAALAAAVVGTAGAVVPDAQVGATSDGGVVPTLVAPWSSGDAATECAGLGYENGSKANWKDGAFDATFATGITAAYSGGMVSWSATFPMGAVIVKGGNAADVYTYDGSMSSDSGLTPPVNASGGTAGLSHLTFCWNSPLAVTKTAVTTFNRTWDWTISKTSPTTSLTLSTGQTSSPVNYTVTLGAAKVDSGFAVSGDITITNPNHLTTATIASVTDTMTGGITAPVSCPATTLAPGASMTCTYASALPNADPRTNTAVVKTTGKVPGSSGTAAVTFGAPTNVYDESVTLTDSLKGALGTFSAASAPATVNYSMTIGPYDTCGDRTVTNTAEFTTNDTGTTGSASHSILVTVPCGGGCTLTQGYWKTHSQEGPAPYDDAWLNLANQEDTVFFLSGKTWYQVFWTAPAGNAYYILADQYMAARLNLLNGASSTPAVDAAMATATTFFATNTPTTTLSRTVRNSILAAAAVLDAYNNGLTGPGHCSE